MKSKITSAEEFLKSLQIVKLGQSLEEPMQFKEMSDVTVLLLAKKQQLATEAIVHSSH